MLQVLNKQEDLLQIILHYHKLGQQDKVKTLLDAEVLRQEVQQTQVKPQTTYRSAIDLHDGRGPG